MLDSNLQGGDGGVFCNLVDAYYSMIWATELESKKTAYGGDYYMSPGVMPQSEYDDYTSKYVLLPPNNFVEISIYNTLRSRY